MAGTLFLIATPIGNLEDITLRALRTLGEVSTIAAEDTRHTRGLLTHHGIGKKRLLSAHAHSSPASLERVVDLLEQGESVAYVTDAGTPQVSDPGEQLVKSCRERGIRVTALPGASAVLTALSVSGLNEGGSFWFLGFLPRKGAKRAELITRLAQTREACVVYESARRFPETLQDLAQAMPARPAYVGRELTKLYEESLWGTLAELAVARPTWRGELSLVLGAWQPPTEAATRPSAEQDERIAALLAEGLSVKSVVARLAAELGLPRRALYARVVELASQLC